MTPEDWSERLLTILSEFHPGTTEFGMIPYMVDGDKARLVETVANVFRSHAEQCRSEGREWAIDRLVEHVKLCQRNEDEARAAGDPIRPAMWKAKADSLSLAIEDLRLTDGTPLPPTPTASSPEAPR